MPSVLAVKDISYSQRSVAPEFSNGIPLAKTTEDLISGKIKVTDIPPIRVVKIEFGRGRGRKIRFDTLDNRRLRVFKDAGITEVSVEMCSLEDPKIKREYELKKTNKKGGDEEALVRGMASFAISGVRSNHFDQGKFVFTKKVLGWTFTQIQTETPGLMKLPTTFMNVHEYYESFLNLVSEEARAILAQGLERVEKELVDVVEGKLKHATTPNNPENPCTLRFDLMNQIFSTKPGDILFLQCGDFQAIAMANYTDPAEVKELSVKCVIDFDRRYRYEDLLDFKNPNKRSWSIVPLGSVITQLRMYDVCLAKPEPVFLKQIYQGNLSAGVSSAAEQSFFMSFFASKSSPPLNAKAANSYDYGNLNLSQKKAIKSFLDLKQGIQLIQGPPGTGKTSTLIQLLKNLCNTEKRILVTAPSNKAIQVLAERFLQACPSVKTMLVGVEDKLISTKPELKDIFIHSWKEDIEGSLEECRNLLQNINASFSKKPEDKLPDPNLPVEFFLAAIQKITHIPSMREMSENLQNNFIDKLTAWITLLQSKEKNKEKIIEAYAKVVTIVTHLQLLIENMDSDVMEKELLNGAQVIFATLSVCGRESMKTMDEVDVIIVDEAGQSVEAETLIPFHARPPKGSTLRKCLLVGDPQQLPATVISTKAKQLGFDRSLMSRLMNDCRQPYSMLNEQYRMHPEISQWPARFYYEGELQDSSSVIPANRQWDALAQAPNFLHPYSFINVEGKETKNAGEGYSFSNAVEADAIVAMVNHLHVKYHIDVTNQVGIITFYRGQVDLLNGKFKGTFPDIKIQTVDGFQGGESDIIIISSVRANPEGVTGFVKDSLRLNVAMTRARYSLMVFGDAATLEKKKTDLSELVTDAKKRGKVFEYANIKNQIEPPKEIPKKVSRENKVKVSQVCRHFLSAKGCSYGNKCHFEHVRDDKRGKGFSKK